MRRIHFTALLLTALIAASLIGCSSQSSGTSSSGSAAAGAASGETVFTYGRDASVTSFDLHNEITSNNAFAIDKVFEPLVNFENDGTIVDWLAESHTISDDGLVYTFVLRDGLKFSDGSDVTADDVVFSLNRHIEVGGALPLNADVASVEAQDDKTVIITLNEAYTPFISELANFTNGILPKDFGGKTEEEFFQNPVGTGPFMVESWDPAGDTVFVKNPYYWQEGKPSIDKLVYKVVSDDNQLINQLKSGDIDAAEELPLANISEIESGADTKTASVGGWQVEELFFNTLDEHFADVHVRRALASAIDRDAITAALTFGNAETAQSVLPSTIQYNTNDSIKTLGNDLDTARYELEQSAYPDGFSSEILVSSGDNTALQIAQIIQSAASQIGIDLTVKQEETATFREDFFAYNFSIMINNATADFPDADSIMAFQVDPDGFSKCYWTNYSNDEAAALLHEGQTTPDGDDRAAVYAELSQILADDVPYIPLYYPAVTVGMRSNVNGLEVRPNGSVRFENVTVD